MKFLFFFYFISLLTIKSWAQDSTLVPYSPDFDFREGIYLTFNQFKNNSPLPKYKLITNVNKDMPTFLSEVLKADTIFYIGSKGEIIPYPKSKIWGYCENNTVFINYNKKFNRILIIGKIGFFISKLTVTSTIYDNMMYPGYYYYDPFYYPISGYPRKVKNDEIIRYLIDFNTGEVLPFDYKNLELLLSSDTELYNEYISLPKRKRKKLIFMYIRRFNERNPLYIKKN
jgi:hypothetical protein